MICVCLAAKLNESTYFGSLLGPSARHTLVLRRPVGPVGVFATDDHEAGLPRGLLLILRFDDARPSRRPPRPADHNQEAEDHREQEDHESDGERRRPRPRKKRVFGASRARRRSGRWRAGRRGGSRRGRRRGGFRRGERRGGRRRGERRGGRRGFRGRTRAARDAGAKVQRAAVAWAPERGLEERPSTHASFVTSPCA